MPKPLPGRKIPIEKLQPWLDMTHSQRSEPERKATLECYFQTVLLQVVAELELEKSHFDLRDEGFHTLISLMGFSPETTVISTAVVRPKRLIVIYGEPDDEEEREKVQFSYNIAHRFLTSQGLLDPAQIDKRVINPIDPIDIYQVIRTAIDQSPVVNDIKSCLVDITGGKKVMSATAGQAAWEMRLPLCYVESGKYEPVLRRPWPGTELVMKLQNPSQLEQLQMRINALNLYANRNYTLAAQAFDTCEANREEIRLDTFAGALCRAYVRWTDLDLPQLMTDVAAVRERLDGPRVKRLLQERGQGESHKLIGHRLDALVRVANAEPLAMIATFQELAQLYASKTFQRFDFACLLVYRGMEATVEFGLRHQRGPEFNLRDPKWALPGDDADLETGYIKLSAKVDKKHPEPALPNEITFVNGLALLCLIAKIEEPWGMLLESFIKQMRGIATMRNESVLAHGTRTLTAKDYVEMYSAAERLAQLVLGDRYLKVQELRTSLGPVDLEPLNDPTHY